jgi:hypothetical protein
MKNHICNMCKISMELVPPGCHRRNAAEVAIRNFKAHFLSVLAGVADDFPPSLCDCLLPQTEITINLIRQSNANATPNVFAYAHLSGPFDYNTMPLAPMGCEAQVHEKTDKCCTWAYHSVDGWSCHPNSIVRITATFCTPRANDYPTLFNSNTSASPIPPSPTPTK